MKRFAFIVIIALQWTSVTGQPRHITVAADGSGEFTSDHEAVNSVRAYMSDTTYMFIKDGVYREKVIIPSWVTNLFMKGESAEKTIITWNDHANIRNMGTFRTYTIWILGSGFTAENITFENNAEQLGPGCRRACRCRQGGLPQVRDTGQPGYSSYSPPGEQAVLRGVLY